MLIDCPSCARSYHVSRAAIGAEGRTVVCPQCETRWFVPATDDASQRDTLRADPALSTRPVAGESHPRAQKRERSALPKRRAGSGFRSMAAALACLVLAMGLIGKRNAVVAAAPRTAALYAAIGLPVNIRGLEFSAIKTVRADDPSQRVEISGSIRNVARSRATVPRITFDIRDANGASLAQWSENAPKRVLASDETMPFVTQAPTLPDGSKDIIVRFDGAAPATPGAMLLHKPH